MDCKCGFDAPHYGGAVTKHPAYKRYWNMRARCEKPSNYYYRHYGGRGIFVSDEFKCVRLFLAWCDNNGFDGELQLDREDNDGPYSPGNCRFVDRSVNLENRRLPGTASMAESVELQAELSERAAEYQAAREVVEAERTAVYRAFLGSDDVDPLMYLQRVRALNHRVMVRGHMTDAAFRRMLEETRGELPGGIAVRDARLLHEACRAVVRRR